MDFKRFMRRLGKKIKKFFKKVKRFIKRYIRLLVRHTKAGDYSVLIYTVLSFIALILVFSLLGHAIKSKKGGSDSDTEPDTSISSPSDATPTDPGNDEITVINLSSEAKRIYELEKNYLVLVNSTHPLPDDYTFTHHTLNCGYDIDEQMYQDLLAMLNACNTAGFEYNILSAYRTEGTSQPVDDAGDNTSEHTTGLAIDLCSLDNTSMGDDLANDEACKWLQANCYNYGFVLRYPENKQDITGITYKPWHFRYVGKNAAIFMHENSITLEEFHELLAQ